MGSRRTQKSLSFTSSHALEPVGIKVRPETSRLWSKLLHFLLNLQAGLFGLFLGCPYQFTKISRAQDLFWCGLKAKSRI